MALELNRSVDTKTYRRINELLGDTTNLINRDIEARKRLLQQSLATKCALYCKINPELESPSLYKSYNVKEFQRVQVTRYRLSSHNLKVETGRWSRLNRENRTCSCENGGIQDEEHVTSVCGLTTELREKYRISNIQLPDLFSEIEDERLCSFFYELSKVFKK